MKYFLSAIIIILISTPLGYTSTNILGRIRGNLSGEYITLLSGFIHSFMLIGVLIFCIGLVNVVTSKNSKQTK